MRADVDGGCAYTNGVNVLYVTGEQQHGEMQCNSWRGEYELSDDGGKLYVNSEADGCTWEEDNNEEGWAKMAEWVLRWAA